MLKSVIVQWPAARLAALARAELASPLTLPVSSGVTQCLNVWVSPLAVLVNSHIPACILSAAESGVAASVRPTAATRAVERIVFSMGRLQWDWSGWDFARTRIPRQADA